MAKQQKPVNLKRMYRVLKTLSIGNELVRVGEKVDLGHLDTIQLSKLEWKGAVEALPNIPESEVVENEE